jgi:serine/threonine protein kinase
MVQDTLRLAEQIDSVIAESQFDKVNKDFVPARCLDQIITREAIEDELRLAIATTNTEQGNVAQLEELATYVHSQCTILFSIAIHEGFEGSTLYNMMRLFEEHQWTDQKLPIEPLVRNEVHELSRFGMPWDNPKIRRFYNQQWTFLAPVFNTASQARSSHDFKRTHVLPFTERHEELDQGSFGKVYKYTIHADHLIDLDNPVSSPIAFIALSLSRLIERLLILGQSSNESPSAGSGILVAVKEVLHRSHDRKKTVGSWEREARILQKMNDLCQDHIVRFLTAFSRGDDAHRDYYLMFEWADGINLRWLWRDAAIRPCLTADLAQAVLKQILGLAMALCMAHCPESRPNSMPKDLNFRHGDLKPENILWYRDNSQLGTLKIADWGLAKQNNLVTPLRTNNTSTGSGTARYKPPEEELAIRTEGQGQNGLLNVHRSPATSAQPRKRSRLYDVWAMGCITLEFLIWLLYGPDGLKRFNNSFKTPLDNYPPFYEVEIVNGKPVARVHNIAVKWMDHMAKDPACKPGKTALGDLLELVRTGLLVVKLPVVHGTSWDTTSPQTLSAIRSRSTQTPSLTVPVVTSTLSANSITSPGDAMMPDIVVSPAGDEPQHQQPQREPRARPAPAPLTSFSSDPERILTPQFLRRMEDIYSDLEDDGYWFTEVSDRSLPPGADDPLYDPDQDNGQHYRTQAYADYGPTVGMQSRQLPIRENIPSYLHPQAGGLALPSQQRVSVARPNDSDSRDARDK